MNFDMPDVDIDFADRTQILDYINGTPARLQNGRKHNTGVHFTHIPTASDGITTIEHKQAEELGYFKLDLLNVNVYEGVRDETHLVELMTTEPRWNRLWEDREFCEKIIHISNYYDLVASMKPDSIPRMAMLLAVLRPGKKSLRNKTWKEVGETVWIKPAGFGSSYYFKKAHAVAYANLVVVHMNLLDSLN